MKLTVTFDGDWRVGSGTGIPGSVDDLVQRDADGLPYLPARTVKGMLRDGCELVADSLGAGWPQVVDALLGTETHRRTVATQPNHPSRLTVRRAVFPQPVRSALAGAGREALRDAVTFVMPHVAIDPLSGTAQEDHLYFQEVCRGGAVLEACLTAREPLTPAQTALLVAGAAAVRRVGGRRRRGLGRCRFEIAGVAAPPPGCSDWLAWLEQNHASCDLAESTRPLAPGAGQGPAEPAEEDGSAAQDAAAPRPGAPAGSAAGWAVVRYEIEALSPLCLPRRTVGNVVETLDHVPGTLLLPLLHASLARLGIDPTPLIREGRALVTPAYPLQEDGAASWPVPAALFARKGGDGLKDPAAPVFNFLAGRPAGEPQLKPYRAGYVRAGTGPAERPTFIEPKPALAMHNTVEDDRQRPTEAVGGVFTFQVIPAGTRLGGELRVEAAACDGRLAPDAWRLALERAGTGYALGRAKHDEFGRVRFRFSHGSAVSSAPPGTPPPAAGAAATPRRLTVWLLSDLLLRDAHLGLTAETEELRRRLETELEVRLAFHALPEPAAFGRARRLEGWLRAWELPRPTLVGLAAGSCFAFDVTGVRGDAATLAGAIRRLHVEGLGERRAEGFGQLRIDAPLLAAGEVPPAAVGQAGAATSAVAGEAAGNGADPTPELAGVEGPGGDFLRLVETESWRGAIREAAFRLAWEEEPLGIDAEDRGGKPPNSQLGALRSTFAQVTDAEASRAFALRWLIHLRATENRADSWPDPTTLDRLLALLECALRPAEGESWREVDKRLRSPEGAAELELPTGFDWSRAVVWRTLFPNEADRPAAATRSGRDELTRALWPFAVSTLVTTVAAAVLDRRERN